MGCGSSESECYTSEFAGVTSCKFSTLYYAGKLLSKSTASEVRECSNKNIKNDNEHRLTVKIIDRKKLGRDLDEIIVNELKKFSISEHPNFKAFFYETDRLYLIQEYFFDDVLSDFNQKNSSRVELFGLSRLSCFIKECLLTNITVQSISVFLDDTIAKESFHRFLLAERNNSKIRDSDSIENDDFCAVRTYYFVCKYFNISIYSDV